MRFANRPSPKRHGTVMIYATVGTVAFAAMVSLAVDVAHVRMVKRELQQASDAAARYAAAGMQSSGVTAAQNNAVAAAANNTADGSAVVVNPQNDVEFGTWDPANHTFTVLSGAARANANAVRVTCRRTGARSDPVSLSFGPVIGKSTADVSAQSVATLGSAPQAGFIGFGGIDLKNNAFIGSYNSSNNPSPNSGNASSNARLGSNGDIDGQNGDTLKGDLVLGPSASASGISVSGSQLRQASALTAPTLPAWSPQSNPGGIPQAYSVSGNTTLPAGNYWFTSLTVSGTLTFSGPSVVYVNGDVALTGTIGPASSIPADLTIYQYGSNTFGAANGSGMTVTASVIAPSSSFVAGNNLDYYGSAIFDSITVKNNASFFFDEALGAMNGGTVVATVQ